MRKVSFALAIGYVLAACGGAAENQASTMPSVPEAPTMNPAAPAAEAPKKEESKETLAQLQDKALKGYFEAMNAHDAKKLAGFYADNATVKVIGSPDVMGREAIAQNYQKLFDAFKDYKFAATRVFTKDDVAIVEWAFNGTHTGDLWGVKATEKKLGAPGADVFWFTPEGQIKEHHVFFDGGTMMSQMGVSKQKARPVPELASTPEMMTSNGSPDEAKNVEAFKAMNTAMEAKKEADWLSNLADTIEWEDMTQPKASKGKAEAKKFFKEMATAFPDSKMTVHGTWSVGDYVISESSWTGTHKGAFFGMPATKKSVTIKALDIVQFKDGKVVKGWTYSNGADFMHQLGMLPKAPGAADASATEKAATTKGN